MIRTRYNPNTSTSEVAGGALPALRELTSEHATPAAWVAEAARLLGRERAYVLLLGGADLVGFRLRVAQSQARADGLPACFDHAALLLPDAGLDFLVYHVPLRSLEVASMTARNGIEQTSLTFLSDGFQRFPNLALLGFPVEQLDELRLTAEALRGARLSDDFVSPLVSWLGFVWGCQGQHNPLGSAVGIPSAMFVESCYAAARQDITPGIQERIVTPEAIWQAARWWPEYYQQDVPSQPLGYYVLGQRAASATWPSEQGSL